MIATDQSTGLRHPSSLEQNKARLTGFGAEKLHCSIFARRKGAGKRSWASPYSKVNQNSLQI